MEEQVLVVPTQIFHALGHFQGFSTDIDRYRDIFLDKHVQFRPRGKAETDPRFKQLIPYLVFCHTDSSGNVSIFQYVRGKGMGESRLHLKRSIGVGGHIAPEDKGRHDVPFKVENARKQSQKTPHFPNFLSILSKTVKRAKYGKGMLRELHEEVIVPTTFTERCVGLINDDATEVGRVHLGIVHRLDVAEPNVISNEPDLIESGFMPLEELRKHREQMESWSAITLDALF